MIKNSVQTQKAQMTINYFDKALNVPLTEINSFEMLLSKKVCDLLSKKHDDFTTEVVLADEAGVAIDKDNYYTFYYTREDLKDVDKYIEWIKSVV